MRIRCVRLALAAVVILSPLQAAIAAEWWMLKNGEEGRTCGAPLEADGVVLKPDEILNRLEDCKLMDDTPSLDLNNVMVECGGNLNQVFIFTKTKDSCEALAKE